MLKRLLGQIQSGLLLEISSYIQTVIRGVFDVRFGWDFSNAWIRDRCWAMLKELGPTLIIGSPLRVSMPDLDAAWSHLQFCMELYTWQLQRGKAFLQ